MVGVIFFFSDEKSSLGATKEMFIHLHDSRHTHKQETKLGVYPLTEKRDPAAHLWEHLSQLGVEPRESFLSYYLTFNDQQSSGSELRWVYRCPGDDLRDDKEKKKGQACGASLPAAGSKVTSLTILGKISCFLVKHGMNIPHVSSRPPVSALSSVTLTFIITLDRELNLDCPRCIFIRYAEATVASGYRGLWLQRRDADLLKVVSCSLHSPCQQTHAVCLAGQGWQESWCRKIPLFQAWPSWRIPGWGS